MDKLANYPNLKKFLNDRNLKWVSKTDNLYPFTKTAEVYQSFVDNLIYNVEETKKSRVDLVKVAASAGFLGRLAKILGGASGLAGKAAGGTSKALKAVTNGRKSRSLLIDLMDFIAKKGRKGAIKGEKIFRQQVFKKGAKNMKANLSKLDELLASGKINSKRYKQWKNELMSQYGGKVDKRLKGGKAVHAPRSESVSKKRRIVDPEGLTASEDKLNKMYKNMKSDERLRALTGGKEPASRAAAEGAASAAEGAAEGKPGGVIDDAKGVLSGVFGKDDQGVGYIDRILGRTLPEHWTAFKKTPAEYLIPAGGAYLVNRILTDNKPNYSIFPSQ